MDLGKYNKALAAIVTGMIGWATLVVASAPAAITSSELIVLATVLATALGVYQVPNEK